MHAKWVALGLWTAGAVVLAADVNAQTTLAFQGVVSTSNVPGIVPGTPVSGTYSFDYSSAPPTNIDPDQGWMVLLVGGPGTAAGGIAPSTFVFRMQLSIAGQTYYSTGPRQAYDTQSAARGYNPLAYTFVSSEEVTTAQNGLAKESGITISSKVNSGVVPYDAQGLPRLPDPTVLGVATGYALGRNLSTSLEGYPDKNWRIDKTITALSGAAPPRPPVAVPIPLGAMVMLTIALAVVIVRGRRTRERAWANAADAGGAGAAPPGRHPAPDQPSPRRRSESAAIRSRTCA